jgi:hypothetical protein
MIMTRPSDAGTRRHRRRRTVAALAVVGVAVLATSAPAFADPPTNSSFETPVVTGAFDTYAAGDTTLTGWTIVSGTVDQTSSPNWTMADGNQGLDLSGTSRGTIQQSFPTTAGVGYTISWNYGSFNSTVACPGGERTAVFSVEGSAVIPMAVTSASNTDPNWQSASTTFTGTGSPVLLQFADTTTAAGPSCGVALDNIAIAEDASVPVVDPEVAAGLLAIAGLGAGAWFMLRRRRVSGPLAV